MGLGVRTINEGRTSFRPRALTRAGLLALAFVSIPAASVQAQTGQITGTVTDAQSGAPIGEVQVFLPGLQLGSLTRADGRFLILNVPAGPQEVQAQRIGYANATQTVTVTAGGTAVADFMLETQALGLDEIVVTGTAGAARRREIGNSITQIDVADVRDRPVSATTMLQSAAPGIEITGGGAQLGQGKQIRLRGNNSVSMTNQPIIYVDGVRMMDGGFPRVGTPGMTQGRGARITASPLDNINPNDIARIEVIKGSAATTLYGTEASAGVIQIFTKRGSLGAPVWTAEIQQGTGWAKKYGVNGVDYMHMEHFFRSPWWGGGYEGGPSSRPCVTPGMGNDDPNSDFDERLLTGLWEGVNDSPDGACQWPGVQWYQTYNLSVRGGGQDLQYFVSGAYENDTGMLPLDELEKYNLQANFTLTPVDNLQILWTNGFTRMWSQSTPSGNNLSGIELQMMRQDRNYMGGGDPRNIAQALDYDFQRWIERYTTGITLNYNPFQSLTNRFTVGYDYNQQEARNLMPAGFWEVPEGNLTADVFQRRMLTFDYVGTYNFDLTSSLSSDFSWGGQAIGDDLRQVTGASRNFPGAVEPTLSSGSIKISEEEREQVWTAGFFFQNVFDLSNKYFLTLGVRVDGNSAFGEGFGLQTYPKASVAYVISDEAWWPESLGTMRLRSAYGQSGRAPGTFDAVRTWQPVGFLGEAAFEPDNRGNPELGPEVTSEFEIGFEGSWLEDRLSAVFTYYSQRTTDALMEVGGIPSLGFSDDQLENVGEIGNKGVELQVDGAIVQGAEWGVDVGVGFATAYSKVLDLGGIEQFRALSGWIIEGHSVPVHFDVKVANPDEFADPVYVDGGEDVIRGPVFPTHYVTPSLTIRTPGNITLSARGEYRGGHIAEVSPIPVGRSVRSPLCYPYYIDPQNSIELDLPNTPALWRERCSPDFGDEYYFDGDYFKLRSVSASIPVGFAFPDQVSNATLTLVLNNAYDWYREVPWYDVELSPDGGLSSEGFANASERSPAPATLRVSLRVSF